MAEKVACRLQTPADESGVRKDLHPITSVEEVILNDEQTLSDKLNELDDNVKISSTKPDHKCIWLKPID